MVTRRQPTKPTATKPRRASTTTEVPTSRAFLDRLLEISRRIPGEEWEKIPRDAAERFDEYLESEKP